jgi:dihydrodipicolinate synthase/N-acetylneuraminate lyase
MFKPEGIYVAMMTPFEDGTINEKVVRQMVDFVIEKGVNGIFPISSVGEFIHLDFEEKVYLMQIVHDQARGRVPVTPGIASTRPKDCIRLAQKAQEIGCEAVVVAPPYYYPISQDNMERHFEIICDAVDISVILYNIPLFAPPISYDVVKRLSRRKNVVAMKDSSGSMVDLLHYIDKIRLIGEELFFLVGREDILFPALMMGAKGCMTAMAGIMPEIMVGIYKAWQKGDYDKARELQFSVLLLIRAMFSAPFPLGFKTALEVRGFNMGPPQQPLSDAEYFKFLGTKSRIEKIMDPILNNLSKL